MSTNFMRFSKSPTAVQRQPGDPECFGVSWDSDEPVCKYDCNAYARCGREMARLDAVKRQGSAPPMSYPSSSTSYSTTNNSKVGVYEAGEGKIIRPRTPADMPPGTEYLPPERAGQSSALERGAAIAFSEGLAAGFGQFFSSCSNFARDITAWHPHAGRWKYGDNFKGGKKK